MVETAPPQRRRLAAILAADIAGWSRLMGADEEGTLARLKALRADLIDPAITARNGRLVKTTGDGMLVEFASVVDAVRCALGMQQAMAERNAAEAEQRRIEFRVGINLGDVIIDETGDIFGDGVNIAARLEGMAEPGGICVSAIVHDQVRGRIDCAFDDIGEQALKNIAQPVRVYRVTLTHHGADAPRSHLSRTAGEGAERQRREAGEGLPCRTSRRSRCCRSPIYRATQSRSSLPTVLLRTLLPPYRESARCLSSPGTLHSPTKTSRSTCDK
jgi:class 3 adenylate cyclase